jgi:hypothetical protein
LIIPRIKARTKSLTVSTPVATGTGWGHHISPKQFVSGSAQNALWCGIGLPNKMEYKHRNIFSSVLSPILWLTTTANVAIDTLDQKTG